MTAPSTLAGPEASSPDPLAEQNVAQPFWRRADPVLIGVFFLSALFYLWTDASSSSFDFGAPQGDHYNQLADAILHGHLALLTPAPAGLVKLSDPYSPALNGAYQGLFHDLALYHGHFYLTWGPTAAFVLFIPWRLLHVGELPVSFAVWIMSTVGLAFTLLTFRQVVRRLFATPSLHKVVLGAVALAFSSSVPYLLRRPSVYEVAISSGYMFVAIAAYFLARSLIEIRHSGRNLVVASCCLGLAAGGRSDLILIGCVALPALVLVRRKEWMLEGRVTVRLLQAIAPFGFFVVLVLLYNYARFGQPFNVGDKYVLAGYDPTVTPLYKLGYLAPSLYQYFVAPPRFTLAFPYFVLPSPNFYPGTFLPLYAPDPIGGLLTTTPIVLWSGFAVLARGRSLSVVLRWLLLLPCAVGLLLGVAISFSIPGGTERYVADFATLFIFSGVIGWMVLDAPRKRRVQPVRWIAPCTVILGVVVGIAFSITGEYNPLPGNEPGVYSAMVRLTSPLPDLVDKLLGHPVITSVASPSPVYTTLSYGNLGVGQIQYFYLSLAPSVVDVVAPSTGTVDLTANIHLGNYGAAKAVLVTGDNASYRIPFVGTNIYVTVPIKVHAGENEFKIVAVPIGHYSYDEPFLVMGGLDFKNAD